MNLQALSAPFPHKDIHWRSQALTEDGTKALALAYLDARDVMDRLDAVCGPQNWSTYYEETAKGRVLCKLSLRINDEWITKTDGAGDTAVEGDKGGISDALKRAAVQWGIGRYLYDLKNVWASCESKNNKWRKWASGADATFANALRRIEPPPSTITEDQQMEIVALCEGLNFPVSRVLKIKQIETLDQLPADSFDGAKAWINKQAKEKETA